MNDSLDEISENQIKNVEHALNELGALKVTNPSGYLVILRKIEEILKDLRRDIAETL